MTASWQGRLMATSVRLPITNCHKRRTTHYQTKAIIIPTKFYGGNLQIMAAILIRAVGQT
jgi:succinate-acetate transporter protein